MTTFRITEAAWDPRPAGQRILADRARRDHIGCIVKEEVGMKFGIGQPVRRYEDLRLITGRGRYTDDVTPPHTAHAFVLRSPVAHARVGRVDATAARQMPGVLFVAT